MGNEFNAVSAATIAAVSTPQGEGGIGVIRISGADAIAVADKCFRSFRVKDVNKNIVRTKFNNLC